MAVTRADLLEDYREAMTRLFGDRTAAAHQLVKGWLAKMAQARAQGLSK